MVIRLPKLEEVIHNKDWKALNQFLTKIGQNPESNQLKLLDYIVDHLNEAEFSQVEINFFFSLGKVGMKSELKESYLSLILERYYQADRWVRNEILNCLNAIIEQWELDGNFKELFKNALLDNYAPLQKNALQILKKKTPLPDIFLSILIFLLNKAENSFLDELEVVVKSHISDGRQLFNLIDDYEIMPKLKPKGIRSLLSIFFRTVYKLEDFRKKIENSEWSESNKNKFITEIDTFERILLTHL